MTRIYEETIVDYPKKEIFQLINAIEEYPLFVPGCTAANIISQQGNALEAELTISKGMYTKSFVTKNTFYLYDCIEMELVRGPLKSLSGAWHLEYIDENKTKIKLDLDMSLDGGFLDMMFGDIIQSMMSSMVQAFVNRAKVIYE